MIKKIVERSGFLDILRKKLTVSEIKKGDSLMADKGFDIQDELKKLYLHLNISPFLKDKVGFEEHDVVKLKQLQGIAYMWRGRSVRSVDFEYSTQSFLYLCLDA